MPRAGLALATVGINLHLSYESASHGKNGN
jgi:hypothetical protein